MFVHGHCQGDPDHDERWWHLPDQLARSGYVVALSDAAWADLPVPKHRAVWATAGHWDSTATAW